MAPQGVVRVLDFNLCGGYIDGCRPEEAANDWADRIAGQVTSWDTDVATFQEVCDGQRQLLKNRLPGYRVAWWPGRTNHYGCGKWLVPGVTGNQDFGIAIFVRATALTAYDPMRFTPLWDQSRTSSAADAGRDSLLCAGANVDQRDALFCTVHLNSNLLDHGIPEAVTRMHTLANGRPVILAGDFNADATDPLLDPLYGGAAGTGAFREVDDADQGYFTSSCRHRAACRSGEPTTEAGTGQPPRKFDYMFGSAGQVRWVGGDTVAPGLSRPDHRILRGEATWATDTTAPATPVVDTAAVQREPDAATWIGAVDMVSGRFTADRIDDLIVRWWNGAVDLYPGRADGTLDTPRVIRSSRDGGWIDATDIAAGDFTGDGWDDLAVRWSRNSLFIYDGTAEGIGGSRSVLPVWSLDGVAEMIAGDVDGDLSDKRDSVVIRRANGSLGAFKVNGTTVGPTRELLPADALSDTRHIALGDAYGPGRGTTDGHDDLFLRLNSGSLYAFAGSASGFTGAAWQHLHSALSDGRNPIAGTVLGDFDGDGRDDLIVRSRRRPADDNAGIPSDDGRLHRFDLRADAVAEQTPLAPARFGWSDVTHFVVGAFASPGSSTELRRWSSGSITGVQAHDAAGQASYMRWDGVRDLAVANLVGDTRDDVVIRQGSGRVAVVATPFAAGDSAATPGTTVTAPVAGWCPGSDLAEVAAGDVVGDDRDDLVVRCADGAVRGYPVSAGLVAGDPVTVRAAGATGVLGVYVDRVDGRRAVILRTADGAATAAAETEPGRYAAPVPHVPAGTWAGSTDVVRDDATGSIYALWTTGGVTRYPAGAAPAPSATVIVRSYDEAGVDHYRYRIDGPVTGDAGWVDSRQGRGVVPLTGVSPGSHVLRVTAVDQAGNASAELTYPVVVPAA
ncbi:hypothetical protein Q0Z83_000580 [Actinoplanes sichuanensis]|nr:hypothetical protein Q0Z83_000580 [Actinoplanes sichuanensis]